MCFYLFDVDAPARAGIDNWVGLSAIKCKTGNQLSMRALHPAPRSGELNISPTDSRSGVDSPAGGSTCRCSISWATCTGGAGTREEAGGNMRVGQGEGGEEKPLYTSRSGSSLARRRYRDSVAWLAAGLPSSDPSWIQANPSARSDHRSRQIHGSPDRQRSNPSRPRQFLTHTVAEHRMRSASE